MQAHLQVFFFFLKKRKERNRKPETFQFPHAKSSNFGTHHHPCTTKNLSIGSDLNGDLVLVLVYGLNYDATDASAQRNNILCDCDLLNVMSWTATNG